MDDNSSSAEERKPTFFWPLNAVVVVNKIDLLVDFSTYHHHTPPMYVIEIETDQMQN